LVGVYHSVNGKYLFSITIVYKNGTFQKHDSASGE